MFSDNRWLLDFISSKNTFQCQHFRFAWILGKGNPLCGDEVTNHQSPANNKFIVANSSLSSKIDGIRKTWKSNQNNSFGHYYDYTGGREKIKLFPSIWIHIIIIRYRRQWIQFDAKQTHIGPCPLLWKSNGNSFWVFCLCWFESPNIIYYQFSIDFELSTAWRFYDLSFTHGIMCQIVIFYSFFFHQTIQTYQINSTVEQKME